MANVNLSLTHEEVRLVVRAMTLDGVTAFDRYDFEEHQLKEVRRLRDNFLVALKRHQDPTLPSQPSEPGTKE